VTGVRTGESQKDWNEVDGEKQVVDSTDKMERSVICNETDVGGRARVTRDEERVLPGG